MNRSHSLIDSASPNQGKVMAPEQFNQVIEAILDGKYSWACVLILRFTGYNPLHFIPYRTYNRLVKENSVVKHSNKPSSRESNHKQFQADVDNTHLRNSEVSSSSHIKDLTFLESQSDCASKVRGGWRSYFLARSQHS